jgi:hypothetical protein
MKMFFEEGEATTMDGRNCSKPFRPNWKLWCLVDSEYPLCFGG